MNNTLFSFYSSKPWCEVWSLIYRKWSIMYRVSTEANYDNIRKMFSNCLGKLEQWRKQRYRRVGLVEGRKYKIIDYDKKFRIKDTLTLL